ncbi:hypothetical protein ILUMI_20318 [Ignelater luminosus]|uniref:RNA-directed DNA polymerase n=1 Tax=Ignelater luminosus TaxID=2038154 RepID=A0A8K0G4Q1_IGNLU|nr:hypothetical protein ILUMI_20318 [Ignelater luminosus]
MAVASSQSAAAIQIGNVGSLSEFNPADNWTIYQERLEQFFVANGVAQDRKVAVLLTLIGSKAYGVLRDICDPQKPSELLYDSLCQKLTQQFSIQTSVFRQRCHFYNLKQTQSETINDWFARVKKTATECQFGSVLDEKVKDKFVTGLIIGPVLDRLCEEDHKQSLSSLVQIAVKKEAVIKESTRELNKLHISKAVKLQSVPLNHNKGGKGKKPDQIQGSATSESVQKVCRACGNPKHNFFLCKFKKYKCKSCKQIGHIASVCSLQQKHNFLELSSEHAVKEYDMYNLKQISDSLEPLLVEMLINEIPVTAEVDTGTGRDLISKFKINLEINNISKENKLLHGVKNPELKGILHQFSELFQDKLGAYNACKVDFKVKEGTLPIFCKPRILPFAFRELVDKELDRLEAEDIITKVENNDWGTPLVPVLKADGKTLRLCADYRVTVNKYLDDIQYHFPRVEELFVALQGGEQFSKLDIRSAYNQLVLGDETRKLLAWSTHCGVYLMNRLPFGAKPACALFQREIEKDRAEHLDNLKEVLSRLQKAGFRLNIAKCHFFQPQISYLGHVIDREGIRKDPAKIAAVVKAPRPESLTELRAFIVFQWTKECEDAFTKAKQAIAAEQSVVHFDINLPIKLVCDASNVGMGAVLLHIYEDGSEKPIYFVSRSLTKTEQKYSVIHKEAAAIYWGISKFYQFVIGRKFILTSDHKPLQAILGGQKGIPQLAAGRLQRWAAFLSGFDYEFQYIKGSNNILADSLSRLPLKSQEQEIVQLDYIDLVQENIPLSADLIRTEIRNDVLLSKLFNYSLHGWPETIEDESLKPYFRRRIEIYVDQGLIMWGYRVIIPEKLRCKLLSEFHCSHLGATKMKALAHLYCWWPSLDADLEELARSCATCLEMRSDPPKTTLTKWPQTNFAFERIHIDYAGPFLDKMFLVTTDAFSKWVEVYEVTRADSQSTIEVLREVRSRFGLPKTIVSDNGSQFTSAEFQKYCKLNGICHVTSPVNHPSKNGAEENAVKCFKLGLKKALLDKGQESIKTVLTRYLFIKVRTRFDLLFGDRRTKARENQIKNYSGTRVVSFEVGESAYARCFNKKGWKEVEIVRRVAKRDPDPERDSDRAGNLDLTKDLDSNEDVGTRKDSDVRDSMSDEITTENVTLVDSNVDKTEDVSSQNDYSVARDRARREIKLPVRYR